MSRPDNSTPIYPNGRLTCLRKCGLVTATAEGRRVRYELADQRLAEGLRILAALDLPGTCP